MTKKERDQWLGAIEKLRGHYKLFLPDEIPPSYRRGTGNLCPLCQVDKKIKRSDNVCGVCLWLKFEGGFCGQNNWSRDTTQKRLDRLDRWEKKLLND